MQKGEIAQLKIQLRATEKGVTVSRPTTDARYDAILDLNGILKRVQIKYAGTETTNSTGSIVIRLQKKTKTKNAKVKNYTLHEIDAVLAYLPSVDEVVWLEPEFFHNKSCVCIRIVPAKNGQEKNILNLSEVIW
ncbi:group I intron-associated PD-(D/E)XK endonuclease [Thiotrichales bacterium HSG14]|nr:group I intron-associated PD-(D/E)XK endonuclease [Thiotrichales bacterium HSG14]